MKRMKTLLSVILALTLALALTVPAFAADATNHTGTIKILDPALGATYTVYKVFDVAADASGELTYTLNNGTLKAALDADPFPGLSFTGSAAPYTVVKEAGFKSADFAKYLQNHISALGTAAVTLDGSESPVAYKSGELSNGYYLIVPSIPVTNPEAALTTVNSNDVSVQDKNDMPFDKDIVETGTDENIVKVGDIVHYKITGQVPTLDTTDTFCSYIVRDKMDEGLTFQNDLVVKIDGTSIDLTGTHVITDSSALLTGDQVRYAPNNANGDTFQLSIELFNRITADATLQGKDIEITYSALVNEHAMSQISENHAVLEYRDDNDTFFKEDSTRVYPVTIIVDKFETGADEQKLAGAKFVLRNSDGKYYSVSGSTVTWVDPEASGTPITLSTPFNPAELLPADNITIVTTNDEGKATFDYLPDGTYDLIEIKAPDGYTLYPDPIPVTVNAAAAVHPADPSNPPDAAQIAQLLTSVVHVANTPKSVLPSTGGRGATMLYIAGLALILVSGAYLVLRKRCEA